MWAVQHVLGGTTIAAGLKRPWLAYPAAYASHLLLDFAFHIDNHALFTRSYQGPPEAWLALAVLDVLSALAWPAAVWVLWRHPLRWVAIVCGFLGYLMDLTDTVDAALPWNAPLSRLPVTGWIHAAHHSSWHHGNPRYFPWQWGIVCQTLVMCLCLWLLARRRGPRPTVPEATEGGEREALIAAGDGPLAPNL